MARSRTPEDPYAQTRFRQRVCAGARVSDAPLLHQLCAVYTLMTGNATGCVQYRVGITQWWRLRTKAGRLTRA